MRAAALNTGSDFHLLDHIAPLAELLQIPLITTEELNFTLAKHYYPQVTVHYLPDLEFKLQQLAEEFDALFECKYWQAHLKSLFRQLFHKEMRLIFCPHGQSDKGYQTPLLAPYATQDAVLVYGDLMLDMLQELNVALPDHAIVGNYRRLFYEKYRPFYDHLITQEIRIDRSKKTLLYAPTWYDADGSTSFFDSGQEVIKQLPSDWNLVLKLHPLLEQRNPVEFYRVIALADQKPNLFVIHECPLIYPILSLADLYLGDVSSVGYDFLSFEKPLYFMPTQIPQRLHSCGTVLQSSKNIYLQLEKELPAKRAQIRALYNHAFSKSVENIGEKLFTQRRHNEEGVQIV
jgi:hypothetical protein